jgi:hypothetical protein
LLHCDLTWFSGIIFATGKNMLLSISRGDGCSTR